jgi:hypothetical protein
VIAPEGAAAILYRSAAHAHEVANALKLTAYDCQQLGVVDTVVPEPVGGAQVNPQYAAHQLRNHIYAALVELVRVPPRKLAQARYQKFRAMGQQAAQQPKPRTREREELLRQIGRAMEEVRGRFPRSRRDSSPAVPQPGEQAIPPP